MLLKNIFDERDVGCLAKQLIIVAKHLLDCAMNDISRLIAHPLMLWISHPLIRSLLDGVEVVFLL